MRKFIKKHANKITITALIVAAAACGVFFDWRHKNRETQTVFQTLGDESYPQTIKSEDIAPLPVPPPGRSLHVPILMYHHVGNPPPHANKIRLGLTVSTANFAAQISWLNQHGFTTISLQNLYDRILGKAAPWPSKPIIITFDDGYQDVFDNAIPILKQHNFTGTFGIITQYPSQQQGDNFYAPWPRIAQAKQDGMEIVCHTQNHFNGKDPKYSAVYIYENLSGCQQDISSHLGSAEPFLIYPYGAYTPTYIQQAQKAGFAMALTIHYGQYVDVADLMQTPRVRVNGDESLARFAKVMSEDYQGASSTPKTAAN